jgi:hypothetical protein
MPEGTILSSSVRQLAPIANAIRYNTAVGGEQQQHKPGFHDTLTTYFSYPTKKHVLAAIEWIKLATRMQIMRELQHPPHAVMEPNNQVTNPTMMPIANMAVAARLLLNSFCASSSSEVKSLSAHSP